MFVIGEISTNGVEHIAHLHGMVRYLVCRAANDAAARDVPVPNSSPNRSHKMLLKNFDDGYDMGAFTVDEWNVEIIDEEIQLSRRPIH